MLVQKGTATLTGTSLAVTLDTPVSVGQSWAYCTFRGASDTYGINSVLPVWELTDVVDGKYTKITLTRTASSGNCIVQWAVISGNGFTVQHGTYSISGAATATVSVTEVDLSKTFLITNCRFTSNSAYYLARGTITNSTTLTFTRYASAAEATTGTYFLVTWDGATVQKGTAAISGLDATATISAVTLANTFMVFSVSSTATRPSPDYYAVRGHLSSTTAAYFKRGSNTSGLGTAGTTSIDYFVVSHADITCQSGLSTIADTTANPAITAVESAFAIAAVSGYTTLGVDVGYANAAYANAEIDSTTSVLVTRGLDYETVYTAWRVIEFAGVSPPENLRPDDAGVMPDEANTFTFTLSDPENPEFQEFRYREVGAATWTEESQEAYTGSHVFTANTFEVGKSYEWGARYWETGQTDPSDWANSTFNTINPVIHNPTPWPDSSVRVDILQFGGRLKSPYGRDVQLTIEIASDADFTSPTTYALPAVESGEVAIVDHAVTEGGTWYIRMTATDTESLQTVLVYSFFAGQFLYFLTMPTVRMTPQQATHVTVRVKDTTTEYTAVVDPAPPDDRKVERLFFIQSGTAATCQAVAEAYLEKLGRPQVSVSGVIPLTVTLGLGQKVRIKIPEAGIDEEMVLQGKEHRINEGEVVTHVTLGDIIVSDSELVARILERLE